METRKLARMKENKFEKVDPEHYKNQSKEVWEMMLDIWGAEAFMAHCEMTAFKYRMRAGKKPGESIEVDLQKAEWYENKAAEIRRSLQVDLSDLG